MKRSSPEIPAKGINNLTNIPNSPSINRMIWVLLETIIRLSVHCHPYRGMGGDLQVIHLPCYLLLDHLPGVLCISEYLCYGGDSFQM
jgi:hypothetical protein